jgi:hypothetical protein
MPFETDLVIPDARALIKLAQTDRKAARERMRGLSPEAQAAAICEAELSLRHALLELAPHPEDVIPLLPEAELCFTCKAIGIEDAAWVLSHATEQQIVACVDLDAFQDLRPSPARQDLWWASLAEAGEETLLRAAHALDPELIALYLRHHVDVDLKPAGTDDDWEPPDEGQTLDGQFYLVARDPKDDLAPLISLLRTLFQHDYWLYFRMLQSVIHEQQPELEEWALRWRTGRLEDLGFPSWDESMRIYGFLRSDRFADLPEGASALDLERWAMPVWITDLPTTTGEAPLLFRAVAELELHERQGFFYAFVALANRVAVADRRDLGDAETLPSTIEKAAKVASLGLEEVSRRAALEPVDVLRRVSLERLFRVGVNVSEEDVRPPPLEDVSDEEEHEEEDGNAARSPGTSGREGPSQGS